MGRKLRAIWSVETADEWRAHMKFDVPPSAELIYWARLLWWHIDLLCGHTTVLKRRRQDGD